MPGDHPLTEVLSEFASTMLTDFPVQEILDRLLVRIVDMLQISAAGVTLIAADVVPRYIAASNDLAMVFEQMQTDLGEGPCVMAYETGAAVLVPDLREEHRFTRFGPRALAGGLVAVFTFPLRDGKNNIGALDLYRDTPGALDAGTLALAQTLADVVAATLLNARRRADLRGSEAAQRELAEQLSFAQQVAGIGSWEWDLTTDTVSWSDELCRICGIRVGDSPCTFEGYLAAFHPDDRQIADLTIHRAIATGQPYRFDHRVAAADGTVRVVRAKGTVKLGEDGAALRVRGTSQDVTDLERTSEALRRSERRLAEAQDIAGLGSWEWDVEADHVTWSDELYALLGVKPGDMEATHRGQLLHVHPEDRDAAESAIQAALQTGEDFAFDHRVVRPDGSVAWVQSRGQVVQDDQGVPKTVHGTAIDITERVALNHELAESALFDHLTGLHNRRGFITLADHLFKVAARDGRKVPLLYIDMDGMKRINDSHGHDEGDRALVDVAAFLRATVRSSDVVARIGGDEFCILMGDDPSSSSTHGVDSVVNELRSGPPGQRSFAGALSVGVAWLEPGAKISVEELMRRADTDMYEDKNSHRRLARVLVVDDDASLRDLAQLGLGHRFDIVLAATGREALDLALEHVPDLILLDLTLPDMAGAEVLRRLRALPGADSVPAIVVTGATGQDVEVAFLQQGVGDFIVKPFNLAVLEARMNNVLNRS